MLKYELFIIIALQILFNFIARNAPDDKRLRFHYLYWFLAIISNALHLFMLVCLLNMDLDPEDRWLFIRVLSGILLLLIFEIVYMFIKRGRVFIIGFVVLQIYLICNIVLMGNWLFGITVIEVNCAALLCSGWVIHYRRTSTEL